MKNIALKNILFLSIIVGFVSCKSLNAQKQSKPNIVYILADVMGYGDLSVLNPEPGSQTPYMDKILKQGVHFTDAL